MSVAYWCILIAAVLPLIWVGFAKSGAPGYNNKDPRGWREFADRLATHSDTGAAMTMRCEPPSGVTDTTWPIPSTWPETTWPPISSPRLEVAWCSMLTTLSCAGWAAWGNSDQ